jgi:hypothetical protein
VFAAPSLDGAAREQYAAMEAGGGAVAAPQNRGSSPTGQPQAAATENRPGPFGHDFLFFPFYFFFFLPSKRGFPQKGGARSRYETRRPWPNRQRNALSAENEINTARRSNALLTCRLVVF